MSYHRVKLTDPYPSNQSFSHNQSIQNGPDSRHKKKGSLYIKHDRTPNYNRLRTDQKEPSSIINEPLKSYGGSMHLANHNNSVGKFSRSKKGSAAVHHEKKKIKNKNTISVINLNKNVDQPKRKGSSTVTKRKHSQIQLGDKIKQKIEDFKIISNCLEQYTKEEQRNNSEVNLLQILKIINAFNRSQIAPISKPLQKLIHEIVQSIQLSIPNRQKNNKSVSFKKSVSFDSPEKENDDRFQEVKDTVKKTNQGSREFVVKKEQFPGQVNTLEENLDRLKYESNRLKYFLEQISSNSHQNSRHEDQSRLTKVKIDELQELKTIAQEQNKIIRQLENSSEEETFRQEC